jgi:hypothetical protein
MDQHEKIKEAFQEEYDRKVQRELEYSGNSPQRMARVTSSFYDKKRQDEYKEEARNMKSM